MTHNRILLAEDDTNFGDVLTSYLDMHGYAVTLVEDGEKGAAAFEVDAFDLCIFDVMMPKKDGFALAREVRAKDPNIPIIFLTAKVMKDDVIEGFKIGADDYIPKPFNSEELLFRIQAVMKRIASRDATSHIDTETTEFNIATYTFNYPARLLSRAGRHEKLSPKEAELLRLFCLNINSVLPRTEALKKIWHEDNYFTARSMDVFVTKLRKYLKDDIDVAIVNVHGNGFQLKVDFV